MNKDKKSKQLTNSEKILQNILQNGKTNLSENFLRWKLWANWHEIVGDTLYEQTEPIDYFKGTLFIWVKHSTWLHQIYFLSNHIKNKINKSFSELYVEKIRFTLDRKNHPHHKKISSNMQKFLST